MWVKGAFYILFRCEPFCYSFYSFVSMFQSFELKSKKFYIASLFRVKPSIQVLSMDSFLLSQFVIIIHVLITFNLCRWHFNFKKLGGGQCLYSTLNFSNNAYKSILTKTLLCFPFKKLHPGGIRARFFCSSGRCDGDCARANLLLVLWRAFCALKILIAELNIIKSSELLLNEVPVVNA
jgi:hypothetical protein